MKSLLVFFCILIRWLFYNFLFLVILKNLTAQVFRSNTVFWNRASGLGDVIWRNSYRTPDAGHRTITIPHFEHLVLSSRGLGGVRGYIYGIVWMCVPNGPLFQRCQVYDIGPFFQQEVYDWPHCSGLVYERPPLFYVSRYMHIFFVQIFCTCSLGIQWIDCYIYLTTNNK